MWLVFFLSFYRFRAGIGKQLVERALAEHQGKLDDILYQKVDQLQEELNQKMEEKLLQAKKKEKQKFEMEMALIVAEKNAELAVSCNYL